MSNLSELLTPNDQCPKLNWSTTECALEKVQFCKMQERIFQINQQIGKTLVTCLDLFKKNLEHDPVVILEFTLDVHFESRFWSERTCFFHRKINMARMKNMERGIGRGQRG